LKDAHSEAERDIQTDYEEPDKESEADEVRLLLEAKREEEAWLVLE